jgi:hypothetical protein
MQPRESRDILRQQCLCVLYSVAPVALTIVLFEPLIKIENGVSAAIADGVSDQL